MRGRNTLWVLGTDHAGIATQAVVEKELASQGTSREELGRETFTERVWEWKERYGSTIVEQYKRLGASCDYERERFTLDEGYVQAVYRVFADLYEKGYIYRDNYMVNWDPGLRSAISDLEIENREVTDTLYEIAYPLEGGGELVVATVRPETMLADTAVAVNPDDERYRDVVGKNAILPIAERPIPVIADEHVDPEFGTGALKITPGHDPNDFEIGRRHGLEEIVVIGEDGRITEPAPERFVGMTAAEAQKAVVAELRERGLLRGEEPYTHSVPFSHRSGERIEPLISLQWFCRMDELAQPAIEAVEDGRVRITPDGALRQYLHGMEKHPALVHLAAALVGAPAAGLVPRGDETYVGEEPPEGDGWEQDPDVLDTWFSSALWPFATLGWPDTNAPEFKAFFPTDVLVTARDIISLWVARMIMTSLEFTEQVPVRGRLRPLGDPGARRPADVEEPRHRHRPARRDRRARRRRAALRPAGDDLDPGRALLPGARPAGPRPRQQDVERLAADPDGGARRRRARPALRRGGGPLDRLAAAARDPLGDRVDRDLRLRPRRARPLRLLLVGALRLVPGDRQAAALRRRRGRVGDAALGARAGARPRASDHAVRHRGDLLVPAAAPGGCSGGPCVPRGATTR